MKLETPHGETMLDIILGTKPMYSVTPHETSKFNGRISGSVAISISVEIKSKHRNDGKDDI